MLKWFTGNTSRRTELCLQVDEMGKFPKVAYLSVFILLHLLSIECCNESVCGSVVSKCLLMQLCRCTPGNYTCSKECFYCLRDSYSECCSCVELCEIPDPYQNENVDSYVGVIDNAVPGLFQALSEEDMDWTGETFNVRLNGRDSSPMSDMNEILDKEDLKLECTVVYLNNCTSVSKCEKVCSSMGASGFRWFHDGCCECVGDRCYDFGLKQSRCRYCSYGDDIEWEDSEGAYHFPEDNEIDDANDILEFS